MNKSFTSFFLLKQLRWQLIFLMLLFSITSAMLNAQTTGKLSGVVADENGEPLIGANVLIDGTNQGAATDFEGYYNIINIRTGTYTIIFRYLGFQSQLISNVRISADQTTKLNATLNSEAIVGEEVIVVAKKPLVEFNQTSSVSSINKDDIKSLPIQSLEEIVNLQAGVVDGHFRGGRIGEVQYQVDGVTANNPFDNKSILPQLDRSAIEEVQVISGTFDAKYGQAMSGVVNTVLKSGSDKFEFSAETFFGDYYTTDTDRYPNVNKYKPLTIQNYQLSVSGPTGLPQTTFFANGRKYYNGGYLFGTRKFTPFDKNDFENKILNSTGDNALVNMNTDDEWSGQAKLTNTLIKDIQLSYQIIYNYAERQDYNQAYRLNPDGIKTNYTTSISHGLAFTHTISPEMFYKINIRQNIFKYADYKYEDLYDPRYIEAGRSKGDANYEDGAFIQGLDLGRFKQETNSLIIKGDYTLQANKYNFVEAGVEGQYSDVLFGPPGFFVDFYINDQVVLYPFEEFYRTPGLRSYYPKQFAVYLQDRIEIGDLVVRAGLRYEYYDAASVVPSNLQNPANSIEDAPPSTYIPTTIKNALAPRLGLSFPISDAASVYFSYGHFYQLPGLNLLYSNSDYSVLEDLQAGGIDYGVMGNPDLKPEFTIQYEFGLKQSISDFLGVQLSFFYKDIRDLLGVEFVDTYTAASYSRFTNIDYGSVTGFTLSAFQKDINNFNTSIDYTLQFAQGNSSDPEETANRAKAGADPRPRNIPFNWDQRHTLNLSAVYSIPDDYALSTILKFGSGQPYTPEIGAGFGANLETNSGRKDSYFLLDLRAEKYFNLGSLYLSVFVRAFNVLNTTFVNGYVFNSTGSPDYALNPSTNRSALSDPSRFYNPRRIEFGISLRSN
ncbi:MAG: TonB-dependent receptor [Ignavibacteriales bacterium]|nr:TonB-dependent receptor [Ignavibacteriales bacterium]